MKDIYIDTQKLLFKFDVFNYKAGNAMTKINEVKKNIFLPQLLFWRCLPHGATFSHVE